MSAKEAYIKKLRANLDEWRADIIKLKAQAERAESEAQLSYYKEIEELRTRQEEARDKLDELREASDDAWEDMKIGLDKAWDDINQAMKRAVSRFSS